MNKRLSSDSVLSINKNNNLNTLKLNAKPEKGRYAPHRAYSNTLCTVHTCNVLTVSS